jgi:hypothetical protein
VGAALLVAAASTSPPLLPLLLAFLLLLLFFPSFERFELFASRVLLLPPRSRTFSRAPSPLSAEDLLCCSAAATGV